MTALTVQCPRCGDRSPWEPLAVPVLVKCVACGEIFRVRPPFMPPTGREPPRELQA